MSKMDPSQSIPAFYAGKSVFITGVTGFMGKILLEKLLYSCPDLTEIFILLRPKKGRAIEERLQKLLALPVFERLRKEKPKALEKIVIIAGNTSEEGLGISDADRRVLVERVAIIFHAAATVRFDDALKDAILLNTRSTRDMCILACQMANLKVFTHVSTAYCQAERPVVEEKIYPFDVDWKKTIKVAETLDDNILQACTIKYLENFPNTYTFSKRLAEQIISDYSHKIPCMIFRPSIVVSCLAEPLVGWVDNFNGPVGMLIGGGKGIVRVSYADAQQKGDYIPVDIATKAMITASWRRGLIPITADNSVHVYNCASSDLKQISLAELTTMGLRSLADHPLEGSIWHPESFHTTSKTMYYFWFLLLHLFPALIIDTLLKLSGRKPILLSIQRKIYNANTAIAYFLIHEWKFHNDKMRRLLIDVPPADIEAFGYEYASFGVDLYFRNCVAGAKKYLLKEDAANIPATQRYYQRMKLLDRICKVLLAAFLIWLTVRSGFVNWILSLFDAFVGILTDT